MTTTVKRHCTTKDRMPPTCRQHPAARTAGCPTCQARGAWYNRQRRRHVRAGTWEPLTPVKPIAAHIEALIADGWTMRQIIARAGVDAGAVSDIRNGRRTRGVTAVTAAAILGVTGPAPDRWSVPAVGTHRRIRALGAIGYTRRDIAGRLGITKAAVDQWIELDRVTATTRDKVAALYDELCLTPGPSAMARARARHFGYAPPMAWDDIDDPDAQPVLDAEPADEPDAYDPITVGLAIDGRLTHAQIATHKPDLVEVVRRLAVQKTDHQIADHLRWPCIRGDAVYRFRQRNNIPNHHTREVIAPYSARDRARAARRTQQAA